MQVFILKINKSPTETNGPNRQTHTTPDEPPNIQPLHEAAYYGHLETCKWLLANGAEKSLTMTNKLGRTPRENAIMAQHIEVANFLEEAAAKATSAA